ELRSELDRHRLHDVRPWLRPAHRPPRDRGSDRPADQSRRERTLDLGPDRDRPGLAAPDRLPGRCLVDDHQTDVGGLVAISSAAVFVAVVYGEAVSPKAI